MQLPRWEHQKCLKTLPEVALSGKLPEGTIYSVDSIIKVEDKGGVGSYSRTPQQTRNLGKIIPCL